MTHKKCTYTLAVMEGDGIGPEVVKATVEALQKVAVAESISLEFLPLPVGLQAHEEYGTTLPAITLDTLPNTEGWLLGPVSHHLYQGPTMPNPSGYLRKQFDLFANIRPARAFLGVPQHRPEIDLVIVRENTEGFYADRNVLDGSSEFRPNEDVVVSMRVITRRACINIARTAFALAETRSQRFNRPGTVTAVHKANVLKRGDGLFLECCRTIADEHSAIRFNDYHADAFAMHLIREPQNFDVVVTTNLFGDLLSDEAAALVGGLGMAPGLNAGHSLAMAQATHGSAPDIAGKGIVNPTAEILSAALLLEWMSQRHNDRRLLIASEKLKNAVAEALQNPACRTPDLGGTATTERYVSHLLQLLS